MAWQPKLSIAECDAILTAPGAIFEMEDVVVNGVKFRSYKNIPKTIRQQWLNSLVHGPKDYLVYQDERYTYFQAHAKVRELAHLFSTRYGCRTGDRIALAARNSPEYILIFWACQTIGATFVSVNAWVTPDVMEYKITVTGCKLVILDVERAEILGGPKTLASFKAAGATEVLVVRSYERGGKIPPGMVRLEEAVKEFSGVAELPDAEIGPEDVSTIYFTSGTTGLPKGVIGTHRQFLANGFNGMNGAMRALLRNGDPLPKPDPNAPQKSSLLSVPLFHATGVHSSLQLGTMSGSKIALMYKWSVDDAVDIIIREKLNSAGGIPFMASALLSDPRLTPETSNLTNLGWGGGPASRLLGAAAATRFRSRSAAGTGYGATELTSTAIVVSGEDFLARPTTCGLPCLTIDLKVLDPEGNVLPPGDGPESAGVGELYVRGVTVASGYWKNEKATAEAFLPDGWYRTGDIGYIDKEGFAYILDRAKDIIIRGGENIASAVVENAIYSDGRLEDVAVFALKDETWGEVVGAAVTTKPDHHGRVTEADLIAHVTKILPKHTVPVFIDVRSEVLPRNPVGKTLKKDLRDEVTKLWNESKKSRAKL